MPSQVIQWFPGHMAKTRRMITENIKNVDAIIENGIFSFGKRISASKSNDYRVSLHFGENVIDEADAVIYIAKADYKINQDYINKKQNIL